MPSVKQLTVMDQNKGMINGHETCSYHTTKNAVLSILLAQGELTPQKYQQLLTDQAFFNSFYSATVQYSNAPDSRRAYRNLNVAADKAISEELFKKFYSSLYFATADAYNTLQRSHGKLDFNLILDKMETEGKITHEQHQLLSGKPGLLQKTYDEVKPRVSNRETDLGLLELQGLLRRIKKGEYDFSAHGLSKATLQKVDLDKISAFNFMSYPGAPLPGLLSGEEDLLTAATLAKISRTKGEVTQALAVGINNQHWVTAVVKKDVQGKYTWDFMDSFRNQTTYQASIPGKFEIILNKNDKDLNEYLLEAYTNSSDALDRKYNYFFDKQTGLPKPDILMDIYDNASVLLDVKGFFVDDIENVELFTGYIERRFEFMKDVGFLNSTDPKVKEKVNQLYHLTNFMVQNMAPNDEFRQKLEPICMSLEAVMPKAVKNESPKVDVQIPAVDVQAPKDEVQAQAPNVDAQASKNEVPVDIQGNKPSTHPTPPVSPEVEQQAKASQFAAENREPKATEGFVGSFVRAIKSLWEGVKNVVEYVARSIGIVS